MFILCFDVLKQGAINVNIINNYDNFNNDTESFIVNYINNGIYYVFMFYLNYDVVFINYYV